MSYDIVCNKLMKTLENIFEDLMQTFSCIIYEQ